MAVQLPPTTDPLVARRRALVDRAAAIWPRLDQRMVASSGGDVRRLARYLARRTSLPVETIIAMLEERASDEPSNWFG
jgi:hypothetical protein